MNNPAHHASTYRAFTVTGRQRFELVERVRRPPQPGQVRIRVEACGICHTDVLAVEGLRPDPSAPIVPGHEIIGVIEAIGEGAGPAWQVGDRVGVGFLGGQDNTCESCRRGDYVNCSGQPQTGTAVDGGYAEVTYARATGLVRIPPGLDPLADAPLLCAGLTMYTPEPPCDDSAGQRSSSPPPPPGHRCRRWSRDSAHEASWSSSEPPPTRSR
ncbi:alcohol dehydrogenase catalytic domain-containing protein [Nonomuraea sp. NPDC049419]|uniref:alcohol dehydrogenase catalytic domain-containing protein n=1 Tax=Nonomuraea sp. NPDC049419 TaxID=3155772 RepID=UPI0034301F05